VGVYEEKKKSLEVDYDRMTVRKKAAAAAAAAGEAVNIDVLVLYELVAGM
jgi:hypothetical protein